MLMTPQICEASISMFIPHAGVVPHIAVVEMLLMCTTRATPQLIGGRGIQTSVSRAYKPCILLECVQVQCLNRLY